MSQHDRVLAPASSTPAETWVSPAVPRNRAAALVAGVALVASFVARSLWRAYGPPYPPRAVTYPPRLARSTGNTPMLVVVPRS